MNQRKLLENIKTKVRFLEKDLDRLGKSLEEEKKRTWHTRIKT